MAEYYIVMRRYSDDLEAWSPSKYAGKYNIGPLWTGAVFRSKEDARNMIKPVLDELENWGFEIVELQAAVVEDIKNLSKKGQEAIDNYGSGFIKNLFFQIEQDIELLKHPEAHSVECKLASIADVDY